MDYNWEMVTTFDALSLLFAGQTWHARNWWRVC